MYRAVLLVLGLLLAVAAAVLVLVAPPFGAGSSQPKPASGRPGAGPAAATAAPQTLARARRNADAAPVGVPSLDQQPQRWAEHGPLLAGTLTAAGATCVALLALARGKTLRGRTAKAPQQPSLQHPAAPVLPAIPASATVSLEAPERAAATQQSDAACTWLRGEAGDARAAAALGAVDDALAAAGWRSRALAAATQPGMEYTHVCVSVALHPAERNIVQALGERLDVLHPAWQATATGDALAIRLQQPAPVGCSQLLLPALQTGAQQPWTQYIWAPTTLGLAITGVGAGDVLHGVLADMLCMYPPVSLALTVLGRRDAELYRAAPQWAEPPSMTMASLERLAETIDGRHGAALRPLLMAVTEPDEETVRVLLALGRRLATLRSPQLALLVAAERPSSQFRALAAALPALSMHPRSGHLAAELRIGEQRISGLAPFAQASDQRELLAWLPRFGVSPPPCVWDTMPGTEH